MDRRMNLLSCAYSVGFLFGPQVFQSSDNLVSIPWWVWLLFIVAVLVILVIGLFGKERRDIRFPGTQQVLPEITQDQMSTGTELESTLTTGSASTEES